MTQNIEEITATVQQSSQFIPNMVQKMERIMVGQRYLIDRLILGLLAGEHILEPDPHHPQLCAGRASHGFESAPRIFIAGAKEKIRSIPDFRFSGGRVFTEPPVGPEEA